MANASVLYRIYDLPWSAGAEQEEKFRRILQWSLGTAVVLGLLFAVLPVPQRDAAQVEEIPERFARLVLEKPLPPPPPPVVREEPEPEPVPEPEPEPVVEQRVVEAEPPPEPVRAPEPAPEPEPVDRTQRARERAAVAGLLPFAQELAALRDNLETARRLDRAETVSAPGPGASPVNERSLITSRAGVGSGGINTAALSRNTGGGGLAGRATTQVESPVAAIGGPAADGGEAERTGGQSSKPARSREEIERVFDANKGAIYALYNRALRENPSLEGKVVLRITIMPDGSVSACEIVSSDLNDPEFEQRLVQRVLLFRFEAKDVEPITTTKPIDFFPA
ncbi:MAG TPA: AgmX/PglI C-terminal domain-containing protein [Gammaproteobacteria bacterium]